MRKLTLGIIIGVVAGVASGIMTAPKAANRLHRLKDSLRKTHAGLKAKK